MLVAAGFTRAGTPWTVEADRSEDDDSVATVLTLGEGDEARPIGGFGGPALYPGDPCNTWCGRSDESPTFVVVRAAPWVTAVNVETTIGSFDLPLGEVVPHLDLRFGALELPSNEVDCRVHVTPRSDGSQLPGRSG